MELVLTVEEAADVLKVSRAKAYDLAARGAIPTVKLGPRLTRVPVDALRRQLDPMPSVGAARDAVGVQHVARAAGAVPR